jgi:hypothetical protein
MSNDGVDWQKLAEQGREMEKMRLLREQTDALNKLSQSQNGSAPAPQVQARTGKSKTTAVVLAVFLGFWTWLYTNKIDMSKFWIGLGVGVGSALLLPQISLFVALGITVWAIVDQARKPESFFTRYPNG